MKNVRDLRFIFWIIILLLLFIPVTNSFLVNIKHLLSTSVSNNEYKELISKLTAEKRDLDHKVKYYESKDGLKTLIKERLNKVEEGELLIKLSQKMSNPNMTE